LAVRIYSLAKELKIDSKELVDICTKVGIRGKGSALASLSDEEVVKLRNHFKDPDPATETATPDHSSPPMSSKPSKSGRSPSQSGGHSGKMPVIVTTRAEGSSSPQKRNASAPTVEQPPADTEANVVASKDSLASADESHEAEVETPDKASASEQHREEDAGQTHSEDTTESENKSKQHSEDTQSEDRERSPGPLARVMKRGDYISPGNVVGRPPTLGEARSDSRSSKPSTGSGGTRARPTVKLAPMPNAALPKPAKKSKDEPTAQKPDMRLPADALRASKSGSKPLTAHLRRHEQTLEETKRRDKSEQKKDDSDEKDHGKKGKGRSGSGPGSGPGGGPGSGSGSGTPMLGGREQRQLSRQRHGQRRGNNRFTHRMKRRTRRSGVSTAAPRKDKVVLQLPCTVRELSEAGGIAATQILRILMEEGVMTTITAILDPELTEFVADELGLEIELQAAVSYEDKVLEKFLQQDDKPEDLLPRPPIITFLGHVDHGKTSLLDKIIDIDVVSGESGGITQHIRAYRIEKDNDSISFVDTPGHEAFTEMRARGANVTDIAVLVVAADDGVMPQTEEAISHARAANVPIVVALNKTDLPGVDINRAMQGLSANELFPSEWGGDVEVIKTSATTGAGVDELLDTLLTVAELHELKANPNREATGTCLEAQQETGRGVVAKLIVQNGTLHVGDNIVCGNAFGRVKAMYDTLHPSEMLTDAGPSTPVNLTGFDVAPAAGELFYVLDDISDARSIAESRADTERASSLGDMVTHVTLENLFDRLEVATEVQTLNIILRADVRGSIEAIRKELEKLDHPEVKIRILQATVGGITEADVTLADASDAIIIGFNVVPDENARSLAEQRGVQIRRYEVIYKITENLKAALEGLLKPEEHEVELGRALVQLTFKISRIGTIAGCRVLAGKIERNARARVIRDSTIIGDYPIDTLRREKDDAKEVREGLECGIKLSGYNDVKEGDLMEVYRVEEKSRSFDN
jgi:translation initiation factor IF-2